MGLEHCLLQRRNYAEVGSGQRDYAWAIILIACEQREEDRSAVSSFGAARSPNWTLSILGERTLLAICVW